MSYIDLNESVYNWQVPNFHGVDSEELLIYEVLIRDFDSRHTFDALREKLDYLTDLGINAIELMPVQNLTEMKVGDTTLVSIALINITGLNKRLKPLWMQHIRGESLLYWMWFTIMPPGKTYFRLWNSDADGYSGTPTETILFSDFLFLKDISTFLMTKTTIIPKLQHMSIELINIDIIV